MSDGEGTSTVVCSFRKVTKKRPVQARQRRNEESSEGEEEDDDVVKDFARKKRRQNPMLQTTKKGGVPSKHRELSSSSSEAEDHGVVVAEHAFAATGSLAPLGPKDQGATATLDIDTDIGQDAQSQFERVQQMLDEGLEKDGKVLYKGSALYGAKKAKDTAKGNASSGMNRVGPVRAPQFLRQTVRWDFAPDICKDYKETGFCTFGDSCKFLHDRSDYKHGWEIERDYASGRTQQKDDRNYEIASDEDDLPDECQICREEFVSPVVTKCKHYFCEKCALAAFRKSKKCTVCNENTGGVFNIAKDLIAKLAGEGSSKKKRGGEESESESEGEEDGRDAEDTEMQMLPDEEGEEGSDNDGESASGEEREDDEREKESVESIDGSADGEEIRNEV